MFELLGNLVCQFGVDPAAAIAKAEAITLLIRIVLAHFLCNKVLNLLGSGEALPTPSIPFEYILLLIELAHAVYDGLRAGPARNVGQEPTGVVF